VTRDCRARPRAANSTEPVASPGFSVAHPGAGDLKSECLPAKNAGSETIGVDPRGQRLTSRGEAFQSPSPTNAISAF
jgi:hypothetical protein